DEATPGSHRSALAKSATKAKAWSIGSVVSMGSVSTVMVGCVALYSDCQMFDLNHIRSEQGLSMVCRRCALVVDGALEVSVVGSFSSIGWAARPPLGG